MMAMGADRAPPTRTKHFPVPCYYALECSIVLPGHSPVTVDISVVHSYLATLQSVVVFLTTWDHEEQCSGHHNELKARIWRTSSKLSWWMGLERGRKLPRHPAITASNARQACAILNDSLIGAHSVSGHPREAHGMCSFKQPANLSHSFIVCQKDCLKDLCMHRTHATDALEPGSGT